MKLYYSPGACSLADHISLVEAGLPFTLERVDLKAHKTADGTDFYTINPKGYVPALTLDDGETITENIAILDWISLQDTALCPSGPLGRIELIEVLSYIATELHKTFAPYFKGGSDADKQEAGAALAKKFDYLAGTLRGDYLFGDAFSVADAYLYVMLRWADKLGIAVPEKLVAYRDRIAARPAVVEALAQEG